MRGRSVSRAWAEHGREKCGGRNRKFNRKPEVWGRKPEVTSKMYLDCFLILLLSINSEEQIIHKTAKEITRNFQRNRKDTPIKMHSRHFFNTLSIRAQRKPPHISLALFKETSRNTTERNGSRIRKLQPIIQRKNIIYCSLSQISNGTHIRIVNFNLVHFLVCQYYYYTILGISL